MVEQLIRPSTARPAANWKLSWGGWMHMVLSIWAAGSTLLALLLTLKMDVRCSILADGQDGKVEHSALSSVGFLSVRPCSEDTANRRRGRHDLTDARWSVATSISIQGPTP